MMIWNSLKAGSVYFLLVFAAGFALGVLRVLLLVPRLGEGTAELPEMPVMLVVVFFGARRAVKWFEIMGLGVALGCGLIALGLLVTAELTLVLAIQGTTFAEYIASRDAVSFTAYLISLGLFAVMPLIIVRYRIRRG
ncbi:MAG: hypothetical protein OEM82_03015 [Acidobacteriota bacterium]|nr:hypothetical protein [Acidobacteriota bacterium]